MKEFLLIISLFNFPSALNSTTVEPIAIEEMATRTVICSALAHGKAFLSTTTGWKQQGFFLFDFSSGLAFQINDIRLNVHRLPKTVATTDGFAIVGGLHLNVTLHKSDGTFSEYIQTGGIKNLDTNQPLNSNLIYVGRSFSHDTNQLAVTYLPHDQKGILALAILDVTNRTFETITQRAPDEGDFSSFWVKSGSSWYFISTGTGRVELLSSDSFETEKVVFKGKKAIGSPGPLTEMRWPGPASLLPRVVNALTTQDNLVFEWAEYPNGEIRSGETRKMAILQGGTVNFFPEGKRKYAVGGAVGKTLFFDLDDGSFFVR